MDATAHRTVRFVTLAAALAFSLGFWCAVLPVAWRLAAHGGGHVMLQQKITPAEATPMDPATAAMVEHAFRTGYGAGGDSAQREHRRRPFLVEDEAWQQFRAAGR